MNRLDFMELSFIDKINYFNKLLSEDKTVIEIRKDIGIGEKSWQKSVKNGGYKYDNKLRQYISSDDIIKPVTEATTTSTTTSTTLSTTQTTTEISNYLFNNFEILKEIIDKYKSTTTSATQTTTNGIIIDLVDDRHLNPTPKSIRVNQFVWNDWQEFCEENKYYSKQELISMALNEYMINHKK